MRTAPTTSRIMRTLMIALVAIVVAAPAAASGALERVGGVDVVQDASRAAAAPALKMPAGVLRAADGRTLWERDGDAERAMASTTKIMTALVVMDRAPMDERVTVSARAASIGEAGVGLVTGQQLSVRQLLEAMMVRSGNDAAFALAEHVGGDVDGFVTLMNEKAAELGLTHTEFANPHGLDAPGHHTSASDLATLATVAMADERFAAIVAMPSVSVTVNGTSTRYENSNRLLGSYTGATGVKTGWTDDAGYCLVASASRDGVSFVAVVLGTGSEDDRFRQARTLLDWGFDHYRVTALSSAEATAALVPVTDYLDRTVTARVGEDVSAPVFDLDGEVVTRADVVAGVEAPVSAGQRLGTLTVTQGTRLLAQVPIVAAEDVPAPDGWERVEIWFVRLWRSVFGGTMQAASVPLM